MKILWLSHLIPYPPKGGVLQRSYNMIKEISKHHDLTLIAFTQSDLLKTMFKTEEDGIQESQQHLSGFCKHVKFVEIPCESSRFGKHQLAFKSLFTPSPYTINWLKSNTMRAVIEDIKIKGDFDLIHFDTISLAPYISEFPDTPKVLDHHNIESHMMLRRAEQEDNLLKRFYYQLEGTKLLNYEKRICSQFDLHLTCSSLDSARIKKIDSTLKVKEIPNGVDIDYFFPQPENEKPGHLIFAGALNWYPNRDAMIFFAREVWPLLKKAIPNITMNLVGTSPPAELLELASTDPSFKVHGFVDDVRNYISSASIYVCPIRDGGGTKLKILDSFAMGMATVSHPVACEGIFAYNGNNVLFASSPEEFVEKILLLNRNDKLRKKLGKNARNTAVNEYAYTSIGKKLSQYYIEILQKYKTKQ